MSFPDLLCTSGDKTELKGKTWKGFLLILRVHLEQLQAKTGSEQEIAAQDKPYSKGLLTGV